MARCALPPAAVADAVRSAYVARAQHRAHGGANLHIRLAGRHYSAKAAVLDDAGIAAVKWYGNVEANEQRGLPAYQPMVMLNDAATGTPLALLDGAWITSVRTAAVTAIAARQLAGDAADSLAIVGCGRQGAAHLAALASQFPLRDVALYSRSRASAEGLAQRATALGLAATVAATPRDAVDGRALVVTTTSRDPQRPGLLRTEWLQPGAFVSMADMGHAWEADTLRDFDCLVTDEYDGATRCTQEPLRYAGPFDADLETLLAQSEPSSDARCGRSALIFAGSGLADAAVAAAVYRVARERGIGTMLPH